jgi:hypothetical protein
MDTIRCYVRAVHPVLVDWSAHYHHLREVTTRDVAAGKPSTGCGR